MEVLPEQQWTGKLWPELKASDEETNNNFDLPSFVSRIQFCTGNLFTRVLMLLWFNKSCAAGKVGFRTKLSPHKSKLKMKKLIEKRYKDTDAYQEKH